MELAGQSCADCAFGLIEESIVKKITIICGPGNNGGDGLVAARHLKSYGCKNVVLYLVRKVNESLVNQFNMATYSGCEIKFFGDNLANPEDFSKSLQSFDEDLDSSDIILDALFGYSFKGPSRQPYTAIIQSMIKHQEKVLSIDVPSGWNIDQQTPNKSSASDLYPAYNISMMLPKNCLKDYIGAHFIGGNFLNSATINKFNLSLGTGFHGLKTYYKLA